MASPRIKATYSLDAQTMRVLERMATRWGVSKSEALRRAIRASARLASEVPEPMTALAAAQAAADLDAKKAAAWLRRVRQERRAGP
jgi:hypothetical protein